MRLIDADKLIHNLREHKIPFNADINEIIITAPTVDAEPVVRCKDCVYCKRFNDVYQLPKLDVLICRYCCDEDEVTENDFCSWGERREDEID